MLKKVLIKGPLLSQSGYGVHARQVFNALLKRKDIVLHTAVTEWGLTTFLLKDQDDSDTIKKIVELSKFDKNIVFDESFQVCAPFSWSNKEAKINIGLTAGFESNFVKKEWIDFSNSMDYLIFPSEFTQQAFFNTSNKFNTPIRPKCYVINESYFKEFDDEIVDFDFIEKLEDHLHYNKNILIIGQLNSSHEDVDRKNIIRTIKTAVRYVDDKDIGILLKINTGKYTDFFKNQMISHIRSVFNKKERRKIKVIFGNLSKKQMYSLYTCQKISCMFSGTRGEGWGLSFLESARCKLPIVATDYTAYKEFLLEDFVKIKYELNLIKDFDENFFDKSLGQKWANFIEEDALEKLDLFFKNIKHYKDVANKRSVLIKQKYNFNKIIKDYNKFFEIL